MGNYDWTGTIREMAETYREEIEDEYDYTFTMQDPPEDDPCRYSWRTAWVGMLIDGEHCLTFKLSDGHADARLVIHDAGYVDY